MEGLETFFRMVFTRQSGYVCIAVKLHSGSFKEKFFEWPTKLTDMVSYVENQKKNGNVYYCPNLFKSPTKRVKSNVSVCTNLWADLDECEPTNIKQEPTIVIKSSEGRYQALWVLDRPIEPKLAEDYSKRIAYAYKDFGADISGWDLTQLLRPPNTPNFKYNPPFEVETFSANRNTYRTSDFSDLPRISDIVPQKSLIPDVPSARVVLDETNASAEIRELFEGNYPRNDWSKALWNLELLCFEHGMSTEQVFAIACDTMYNKYARDGRSSDNLWQEVCKAAEHYKAKIDLEKLGMPERSVDYEPVLTDKEREEVANYTPTFIERYVNYVNSFLDAPVEYHYGMALGILSGVVSTYVKLYLPYKPGGLPLNLWMLIIADSTLTRKSTSIDTGMDMLHTVVADATIGDDGSPEGIIQILSERRNRASIFHRDEFSGFLTSVLRKDSYQSGTLELFCRLYDGKDYKRVLRRDTINVQDPIFLVIAGTTWPDFKNALSEKHARSGFLPRFILITGSPNVREANQDYYITHDSTARDNLIQELLTIQNSLASERSFSVGSKEDGTIESLFHTPKMIHMSNDAWLRVIKLQKDYLAIAKDDNDVRGPMYQRLSESVVKVSALVAVAENSEIVELRHVLRALSYGEKWILPVENVLNNIGISDREDIYRKVMEYINRNHEAYKAEVMKRFKLSAKDIRDVEETLRARALINIRHAGSVGTVYEAV